MLLIVFAPHFYCRPQTSKNQIKVEMVGDNFTELRGEIAGPPDTPYEGTPLTCTMLTWHTTECLMVCHCQPFTSCLQVADIILKLKSQKPTLSTLQRYVSHVAVP